MYPEEITLWEKFIKGLPADMLIALIRDGGLSPKVNTLEDFVSEVKAYENSVKTAAHYLERSACQKGGRVPSLAPMTFQKQRIRKESPLKPAVQVQPYLDFDKKRVVVNGVAIPATAVEIGDNDGCLRWSRTVEKKGHAAN
ncbi:hypothetical protein H0H92_008298 [Tricholoma furcatifolium]|nr:hypothetical protein H0H92_008298 [Tricholoma furcatifolium]